MLCITLTQTLTHAAQSGWWKLSEVVLLPRDGGWAGKDRVDSVTYAGHTRNTREEIQDNWSVIIKKTVKKKPVAEKKKPAADKKKPVADKKADKKKPVTDKNADKKKPVAEKKKPAADKKKPVSTKKTVRKKQLARKAKAKAKPKSKVSLEKVT